MSTHIGAAAGQIAPRVMLPGDPLRAKWIAETFLDDAECYSTVRNMLGFTGTYRGERVSVQGTGMGLPSFSIYANELIREYDAQQLVRVGSCGSLVEEVKMRDMVIAISASTDSSMNKIRFEGLDYAPAADFELLRAAAASRGGAGHAGDGRADLLLGLVLPDRPELMDRMVDYGVVAVEMESNALYTLAARYKCRALSICTVCDHLVTKEELTSLEREQSFDDMVRLALDTMLSVPLR